MLKNIAQRRLTHLIQDKTLIEYPSGKLSKNGFREQAQRIVDVWMARCRSDSGVSDPSELSGRKYHGFERAGAAVLCFLLNYAAAAALWEHHIRLKPWFYKDMITDIKSVVQQVLYVFGKTFTLEQREQAAQIIGGMLMEAAQLPVSVETRITPLTLITLDNLHWFITSRNFRLFSLWTAARIKALLDAGIKS